jgi:diaminopimelate decarboxylase
MTNAWPWLRELNARHGDSFYLFDSGVFRRNFDDLRGAFRGHYANTHIAYSYKANYLSRIAELVDGFGGYAEVASRMEYDLARHAGVAPEKIVFNGPYKPQVDIEMALLNGSIVNLDSWYELDLVEAIVRRAPALDLRVGLRCNFDLGTGRISRFGFDADGPDLGVAFHRLSRMKPDLVDGLHCHGLLPGDPPGRYGLMTRRLIETATRLFGNRPPGFLDAGGAFCSRMSPALASQFDYEVPSFEAYAAAIAEPVSEAYGAQGGPKLLIEPGLALTANSMRFVSRVIDVKAVRSRRLAQVAGSIYDIRPTLHSKQLPLSVVSPIEASKPPTGAEPTDIVGSTCLEHDCLLTGYRGDISAGDYVVIDNVGAYATVLRPEFIHPAPPVVSLDLQTGESEVL